MRLRWRVLLILALCAGWSAAAQAGILTPFRRGFTDFQGGRIILSDPKAPVIQGLDFVDLERDLQVETVEIKKEKRYRIRFKVRFQRPDWSITVNGDALEPVVLPSGEKTGELEGAFFLNKEGEASLALAAVSARGDVEEMAAQFEFYDWDLFVKERDLEPTWNRQGLLWGEVGYHVLTDTQAGVTTTTPANFHLPHALTQWSWWFGRLPESRAWLWTLHADVAFVLPLQGRLWAPPFSVSAAVQRRNLFNAAMVAGVRVPWHPGFRLRSEGYAQGAQVLSPTAPTVVTQSFTPRYNFLTWVELFLETELELSAVRLTPQLYFGHSAVGTSYRSDTLVGFLPGGWTVGLKARLNLPAPRERLFATLDFRYQALTAAQSDGSTSVLTDLGIALGFGYTY